MSIISWIILGLAAGLVATRHPRTHDVNPLVYLALGTTGAIVGGMAYQVVGSFGSDFAVGSVVTALLGAVLVLIGHELFQRRRLVARTS